MVESLELTLTLRPEGLREAAEGRKVDIIDRLRAAVPSLRYVTGNVHYSVTVALDPKEEAALRASIQGLCSVARRTFVEPFGEIQAIPPKP